MAILQTLNPFSTNKQKERKIIPIGGVVGFFSEEISEFGEMLKSPRQIAVESLSGLQSAAKDTAVELRSSKFDITGSLTGFKKGKSEAAESIQVEEIIEFRRQTEFFRNTKEDLGKVAMETSLAESLKAKLEEVNRIFGVNLAYKGTLDKHGNERTDVKVHNERKLASMMNPREIKTSKDNALALATGTVNPVDLNSNMEGGTGTGSSNISATGGGAG